MSRSPFYSLFAQMKKKNKPRTAKAYFASYLVAHDFRKGVRKMGLPASILPKVKGWQVSWQYPSEY